MSRQFAAGVATQAEGVFSGLLLPLVWPAAIWGLGPEDAAQAPWGTTAAATIALYALAFIGFWRLAADRVVAPLAAILILVAGFGLFEYRYEYSYGAYKFILLSWWLMVMVIAVVLGIRECARVHASLAWAAAIVACTMFGSSRDRSLRPSAAPPQPNLATLRGVHAATDAAAGEPIDVAVMDNTAAHWAAYFLRASKARLVASTGYLANPAFQSSVARATPIPWDSVRWLLTDATDPGPVSRSTAGGECGATPSWRSGIRVLLDGRWSGRSTTAIPMHRVPIWSGSETSRSRSSPPRAVRALRMVHAELGLSQALPSSDAAVRIRAQDGVGTKGEWDMQRGGFNLALGLHKGENVLTIEKTAPVGIPILPTADQRHPFMVGLLKPTQAFSPGASDASSYCR